MIAPKELLKGVMGSKFSAKWGFWIPALGLASGCSILLLGCGTAQSVTSGISSAFTSSFGAGSRTGGSDAVANTAVANTGSANTGSANSRAANRSASNGSASIGTSGDDSSDQGSSVGSAVAANLFPNLSINGVPGLASMGAAPSPDVAVSSQGTTKDQAVLLPPPAITVASTDQEATYADVPTNTGIPVQRIGSKPNEFSVQVPDIDRVHVMQADGTLCWAACTQMILAQQDIKVDQTSLGNEFRGDQDDQSASLGVIMRAMNPDLEPQFANKIDVPIELFPITSDQMIGELMHGNLVVAGLVEDPTTGEGHACVVSGATFARIPTPIWQNLLQNTVTIRFNMD